MMSETKILWCAFCGRLAQGNYSIHRDAFLEGIEMTCIVCHTCGAQSYGELATVLHCSTCYKALKSRVAKLEALVEKLTAEANGFCDRDANAIERVLASPSVSEDPKCGVCGKPAGKQYGIRITHSLTLRCADCLWPAYLDLRTDLALEREHHKAKERVDGLDAGHHQGRDAGREALPVDDRSIRGIAPDCGSVDQGHLDEHPRGGAPQGGEDDVARVQGAAPKHGYSLSEGLPRSSEPLRYSMSEAERREFEEGCSNEPWNRYGRPEEDEARRAFETYTRACGYEISHTRNWGLTSAGEKAAWAQVVALPRSDKAETAPPDGSPYWKALQRESNLRLAAHELLTALGFLPYATNAQPDEEERLERVVRAEDALRDLLAGIPRPETARHRDVKPENIIQAGDIIIFPANAEKYRVDQVEDEDYAWLTWLPNDGSGPFKQCSIDNVTGALVLRRASTPTGSNENA